MEQPNPTFAKILILDIFKFKQWKFKIQQYLQNEHYAFWEVIEFGDSYEAHQEESGTGSASESFAKKKGRTVAVTTEDMQKRRNDVKPRTTLLLAFPDEHQLRFSKYKTAQELWGAILKTFGGNEATKKTKKNQLKQQYRNFKAEEWLMYMIVWRNRGDLDTMSLDDLYNHLKVYEPKVQKKSESNSQNMAFISSAKNNSGKEEVNNASILTVSTHVSPTSADIAATSISLDTVCAYIASQSNGSQIKYEDIHQIDEDDIEEMDIKWTVALLSMRADRFWKKTGKKITIQGTDMVGFDKSKVKWFNCHKIGHFAKECRAPRSQDKGRREIYKQGSKEEEQAPKALMVIDGVGWDLSYMAKEEENHALVADEQAPTDFALMAKSNSSSENEVFDNSLCFKSYKKITDSLNTKITNLTEALSDRLLEFADDTITDYSRPSSSVESNSSDIQNSNSSVSEHGESSKSIISKPMIKFVKAADSPTVIKTNTVETTRKPSIKYAEMYRNTSKSPRTPRINIPDTNVAQLKRTSFAKPSAEIKEKLLRPQLVGLRDLNRTLLTKGNSQNIIDDKGYWDSGCSQHMTGNISYLSDYEPYDGGYVSFGQGDGKITGKGIIKISKLEFENVYFVKDLKYNLFSLSQICDNKNNVLFTDSKCIVLGIDFKLKDDTNVLLMTPRQHNMYSINLNNIVPHKDLTGLVAKASADESMLWHRRLGHLNFKTMNKLVRHNLVKGLPSKCFENDHTCIACLKGKQHTASSKTKLVHSVSKPFHTLHMDLFGPTSDETSGILMDFITEIENLKDLKVKIIRCDNGGEFKNREMNEFCTRKGIKREFSNARTPLQNGVAERRNRYLIKAARTMLADAKLLVTFWAEAVNTACYVQNRVLVNKSQNKTSYELFNSRTPAIGFLKLFGCHVMILNTLDHLEKFDAKGDEGYFIGYSMSSKAFRVFNKRTKRVDENLHVDFLENKLIKKGVGPNWLFNIDTLTNSTNYVLVVVTGTSSTNFLGTKDAASQDVKKDVSYLRYIALPNWFHEAHLESSTSNVQDACNADAPESSRNSNPTATSTNPLADQMETLTVESAIPTVSLLVPTACLDDSPEPSSTTRLVSKRVTIQDETPSLDNISTLSNKFKDILGFTTTTGDTNGVEADLGNMEYNISASPTPTFRIHKDHPKRVRPIGTKWVLKNKKDKRGIVIKNKARLVAQGHTQEEGIDYKEVFAPVARIEAIRLFLAYASFIGFTVYQMDVKSTFLYGTIDEEVYVMQPPGFQDPEFPDKVYKVEKAMYGLHQAPRAWRRGDFILAQVYVDDIIFGSANPQLCREFEALMHDKPDIMFAVCACARHQVTPKECHLYAVKRIFRYLKGHPKLGLWYPKESPFDLVAYSDDDNVADLLTKPFDAGRFQYLVFWSTARIETTDEGTKILAIVDGKPRTISESLIRRNLKLNDEEGISSLPDAELFENLALMGYNILPNQKSTFQKGFNEFSSNISTVVSKALPTAADEPAFLFRYDSQGEAFPTVSGLEAGQDRENIIKTSALPHDSTPRVTSLAADEGSMQQQLHELTDLCTCLQRQQTEMATKIAAQDLEISNLKARIKILKDKDKGSAELSGDDAPLKGRSLETGDGVQAAVSVPPVGEIPTIDVPTGSGLVPIVSAIFTTASVVTPYLRRKGKEKMVESDTPKKKKL
nr:hypothetical protein [Tanacetum cinerariifolium]